MSQYLRTIMLICVLVGACARETDAEINALTPQDKAFFEQIRKAVLSDDIGWLSEAVAYPIEVRVGKGKLHLKTKADLKRRAVLILSKRLKEVVKKQSAESLFKNWQGVMIGSGELWFDLVGRKGDKSTEQAMLYRIVAINLDTEGGNSAQAKSAAQ